MKKTYEMMNKIGWFVSYKEFIEKFKRIFVIITLFSCAINCLTLFIPLYSMQLIDKVVVSHSVGTLVGLTCITIFAISVMSILEICRTYILTIVANIVEAKIGWEIVEQSIKLSSDAQLPTSSFLRDLAAIKSIFSGYSAMVILDLPWSFLMLVLLYFIDPIVWFAAIIGLCLLIALSWIGSRSTYALQNSLANFQNQAHKSIDIMTRNSDVIVSMGMDCNLKIWWQKSRQESISIQDKIFRANLFVSTSTRIIRLSMQVMSVGIGVTMVILQNRTLGGVMACSMLLNRGISGFEGAINCYKNYRSAISGYLKIRSLFLTEQTPTRCKNISDDLLDSSDGISLRNVDIYYGEKKILSDINLFVKYGEAVCFLGKSGVGKTSIIKAVAGLKKPNSGIIKFGHTNIYDEEFDRKTIGYVPQNLSVFPGISIAQNISRLSLNSNYDAISKICDLLGLGPSIADLEFGMDSIIGKDYFPSGGQLQLISIARSLYSVEDGGVKYLFMDEPNAWLDSASEEALVRAIVFAKKSGAAVIFSTHKKFFASLAESVKTIDNGMVINIP